MPDGYSPGCKRGHEKHSEYHRSCHMVRLQKFAQHKQVLKQQMLHKS